MARASVSQDHIQLALAPLLANPGRWTLHFPMYINTFCLAYHLAFYLKKQGTHSRQEIDEKFVSDAWWREHPTFMYRTDIEIFVAVESTIQKLRDQGHENLYRYRFTNYLQKYVFRRDKPPSSIEPPLVVTDVPQTVEIMREKWAANPPPWLLASTSIDPRKLEVRKAWTRGVGDLVDERSKIYAFSAPLTQILWARSQDKSRKYECLDADTPAIPTFYVARYNSGVSRSEVQDLIDAIQAYYRLILDERVNRNLIKPPLANAYAQLALTGGQPNPFPEIYPGSPSSQIPPGATLLAERYVDMLDWHHERGIGVP